MVVQFSNADIPQIVREFQTDFFIHEPSVRSADVILSKLRWNRAFPSDRQLQDIAGIVATQQGQLDLGYLRKWAGQIAEASLIEDVLSGKIKLKET